MISSKIPFNTGDYERKKLDVSLLLVIAIACGLTLAIYALLTLFQKSYLGILLLERGFTQYLTVGLACAVFAFTVIKWIKILQESQAVRQISIPQAVDFGQSNSKSLINFQQNLARSPYLAAIRCSRIIGAYIQSGSRKSATEFALDDGAFYLTASESSYAFPRILVWAIPLLGFIGTVIGISQAVNGFSGFLENTADVEQIKAGIGTVTSGLAVAFDTTLLALFLSVVVMIPLVLVERWESRFLLRIDIFINDYLLPRFPESGENLDERVLNRVVNQAFQQHLPTPESLIEPAKEFAKQAASQFIQGLVIELESLQNLGLQLASQIEKMKQNIDSDRHYFADSLNEHRDAHQRFIEQLDQMTKILDIRIQGLNQSTEKFIELSQLKETLEQLKTFLERNQTVNQSIQNQLLQLNPILEKMSRPRIVSYLNPEEGEV